jgi:hypothetical protein
MVDEPEATEAAPPLVTVCAWCAKEDQAEPVGATITHGICERHAREMLAERNIEVSDR